MLLATATTQHLTEVFESSQQVNVFQLGLHNLTVSVFLDCRHIADSQSHQKIHQYYRSQNSRNNPLNGVCVVQHCIGAIRLTNQITQLY